MNTLGLSLKHCTNSQNCLMTTTARQKSSRSRTSSSSSSSSSALSSLVQSISSEFIGSLKRQGLGRTGFFSVAHQERQQQQTHTQQQPKQKQPKKNDQHFDMRAFLLQQQRQQALRQLVRCTSLSISNHTSGSLITSAISSANLAGLPATTTTPSTDMGMMDRIRSTELRRNSYGNYVDIDNSHETTAAVVEESRTISVGGRNGFSFTIFDGGAVDSDSPWAAFLTDEGEDEEYILDAGEYSDSDYNHQ